MPGANLTDGDDPIGTALAELEARINAMETTGPWAPGMVAWTAGSTAPPGFLIADGSAFDVARYAQLAVIFPGGVLPDWRDRFVVGAGNTYALLTTGGAASVTLTALQSGLPTHMHTVAATTGSTTPGSVTSGSESAHTHTPQAAAGGNFAHTNFVNQAQAGVGFGAVNSQATVTGPGSAHTHTVAGSAHTHTLPDTDFIAAAGAAQAHSVLNPYVALTPLVHI